MEVTLLWFCVYLASESEWWKSSDLNLVFTTFAQDSLNLQAVQRNGHFIRNVFKTLELCMYWYHFC